MSDPKPDLVLKNGVIYTLEKKNPWAAAMAISGGKIVGIGSNEDVESFISPKTKVIDVGGKLVLPSLVDARKVRVHYEGIYR